MTASCLCGGVRIAISGKVGPLVHCHCFGDALPQFERGPADHEREIAERLGGAATT